MNKTLTINLGGNVFHIDEDAYIVLHEYLDSLKNYFRDQEGSAEILADIEDRIAEIFGANHPDPRQVVTLAEVNDVIAIMGRAADIDPDHETALPGEEKGPKRFFRDPVERVIAGVCSGIAAYFHIDPVWVRLLFVLFVGAGGTGILFYLVLWIVIPEAKTTSERLEMRGKKINVPNIQHSIKEEMAELGHRLGDMASSSAGALQKAAAGSRPFFRTLEKGLKEGLTIVWKGILVLAGLVLSLIGLGLLIAIVAYGLGWTGGIYADNDLTVLSFPDLARITVGCNIPVMYLQAVLLLVLGIPSFMLLYNGLRMVFRFERIRYLGLTVLNIWIVSFFFMTWFGFRIYHLYQYQAEKQITIPLENPRCDTLSVVLFPGDPGMKYVAHEQYALMDHWKTVVTGDGELCILPAIRIETSDDSLFAITQVTIARGKSRLQARQHLSDIRFQSASSGSTLKFSPFLRVPGETCWRGQVVDVIIRVPKGKYVRFDPAFRDLKPWWGWMMYDENSLLFRMTPEGPEACHDSISRAL